MKHGERGADVSDHRLTTSRYIRRGRISQPAERKLVRLMIPTRKVAAPRTSKRQIAPHLRKPSQHGLLPQQRFCLCGVLYDLCEVPRLTVSGRQTHQPAVRAQKDVEQRQYARVLEPLKKPNLRNRRRVSFRLLAICTLPRERASTPFTGHLARSAETRGNGGLPTIYCDFC